MLQSSGMKYAVARLKRNPGAAYESIRAGAAKQKLAMHPIVYGRARAWLGLPKRESRR